MDLLRPAQCVAGEVLFLDELGDLVHVVRTAVKEAEKHGWR